MHRAQIKTANFLYMIAAWGLLIGSVVLSFAYSVFPDFIDRYSLQISSVITLLVIMLPSLSYLHSPMGQPLEERFALRSLRASTFLILPMAFGGYYFFTGVHGVCQMLFQAVGFTVADSTAQTLSASSLGVLVLLSCLLPGIIEEFLFRGIVLPSYEHKGKWKAIALSAALFSTLHGQPTALLPQFMLGLLLGYIGYQSRSVLPCMLYHVLHNSITVVLYKMSEALLANGSELEMAAADSAFVTWGALGSMLLFGGAILGISLYFFAQRTRQEHFPGLPKQERATLQDLRAPVRRPYLPLWIGAAAAAAINILGVLSTLSL